MTATQALTVGNAAKLYCLNLIHERLQKQGDHLRILDLGSGTSKDFVRLLAQVPNLHYTGIEPDAADCEAARRLLPGPNVQIINDFAYDMLGRLVDEPFDILVSFSVMEHVYQRQLYLQSAAACLKPDGVFLINYDAGHFMAPASFKERLKNRLGPVLARLGQQQYYQAFVPEADFLRDVRGAGLEVAEAKFFNTRLKGIYKHIPEAHRDTFMHRWLDEELWLNELGITYTDALAQTWYTRNFVLRHAQA